MEYTIREMKTSEYPLLEDFLYHAIFIPKGSKSVSKTIIKSPELQVYIDHFGDLKDDRCLVAQVDDKIVGAVWVRIMLDYGHVDDKTPSFAISLYPEYRGLGIGTRLMEEMLNVLKNNGYKQASLAVQKENYAVNMYQGIGFVIIDESIEEYIMLKYLQ